MLESMHIYHFFFLGLVGSAAGIISSIVTRGGVGIVGNIIMGFAGAFLGWFLAVSLLTDPPGFRDQLIASCSGATLFLVALRLMTNSGNKLS